MCRNPKAKTARRGASAVETALMLPLLIVVTFGAIDVSQYVSSGQVITNASREAARVAARAETESVSEVESAVLDYLVDAMPHLSRDQVDNAVTIQVRIVTGRSNTGTAQLTNSSSTMMANLHRPLLLVGNSMSVCYVSPTFGGNGKGNGKGNGSNNGNNGDDGNDDGDDGDDGGDPGPSGNTYASISGGDLSEVESGTAISVQVEFDFEAIRWLSGPTYGLHLTETVCRRE